MAAAMTHPTPFPNSTSANFNTLAASAVASAPPLVNKPSLIEYKNWRFLIHDAPTNANIDSYIAVLKKRHCIVVVRACEPTYDKSALLRSGIRVVELPFSDGEAPPDSMINDWLKLCREVFDEESNANGHVSTNEPQNSPVNDVENVGSHKKAIAVHCVAGLGRAPVLVAIALIEQGLAPFDAIAYIRKKRRGAINTRQLRYIESYKVRGVAKGKSGSGKSDCVIM